MVPHGPVHVPRPESLLLTSTRTLVLFKYQSTASVWTVVVCGGWTFRGLLSSVVTDGKVLVDDSCRDESIPDDTRSDPGPLSVHNSNRECCWKEQPYIK